MADFDPEDKNSWYFGPLSRRESNEILMSQADGVFLVRDSNRSVGDAVLCVNWYFGALGREETNGLLRAETSGVFLVRDSSSIRGDFVLCVKEDSKVSHYIVNKIQSGGMIQFRIGDQEFPDLPALLNFYKTHYLDTTSLIRPAPRERYVAKYDFAGRDPEDLPFKKGEVLTVLQKDEDQWWTAKNAAGSTGLVPVPYVTRYTGSEHGAPCHGGGGAGASPAHHSSARVPSSTITSPPSTGVLNGGQQRHLPAMARVTKQRIPNAYDTTQLKLEVGAEVKVLAMNIDGQWEGECNGKRGLFPFTHVQFIADVAAGNEDDDDDGAL